VASARRINNRGTISSDNFESYLRRFHGRHRLSAQPKAAMSNIIATLDEPTINRLFAQSVIRGSQSREIKDPLFGKTLTTVTLQYEAKEFHARVEEGRIRFSAKIHATSNVFSYTDDAEGSKTASMEGKNVVLTVGSFVIALYVMIAGRRFEMGQLDVAQKLPAELKRVSLNILPGDIIVPTPGGASVTLQITNATLALHPGTMVVKADLI
jgi:hypothetical protein